MNGAEAPENRVRVLRRALTYFGGGGLPEAKFRFIWPYHALLVEVDPSSPRSPLTARSPIPPEPLLRRRRPAFA